MRWTTARWNRVSQWPLTAAAIAFLAAYAIDVIGDLHGRQRTACDVVINVTWAMFIVDYVVQLALAERRGRWFVHHLLDLAAIALPFLRPLRLLRLVQLFRVLQRTTSTAVRGRVAIYVLVTTALLVFVAALAMLDVERHAPHATIVSFGDALWWAIVTITTVGYGDVTPVTIEGRFIAVGVMIGGIALIGTVTATIASWIIEQVGQRDEASQAATQRQVTDLAAEVRALRTVLEQRGSSPDEPAGVSPADDAARPPRA
jgi:voltage-gated potassium channel